MHPICILNHERKSTGHKAKQAVPNQLETACNDKVCSLFL